MEAKLTSKPLADVEAAIRALDLESVKVRLTDAEVGNGWTREYANRVEAAYRTYLSMLARYPDEAEGIALSRDVDEFWHTHILQTFKYTQDCQAVFGRYLHHNPHLEARTPEFMAHRAAMVERTRELYEQEFGRGAQAAIAWLGGVRDTDAAAYSSAAVAGGDAAYSSAAIREGRTAYSSASIAAKDTAYSSASVSAGDAAYSSAAIREGRMAYSSASITAKDTAYSSASVSAGDAAYSSAGIREGRAAYSSASIAAKDTAYSSASVSAGDAAYSSAAIRRESAAYSSASIGAADAAYSSAAVTTGDAAYSSAGTAIARPAADSPEPSIRA